jgi:hypothetical protein
MLNFFMFTLFSSIEFLALIVLTCSLFNVKISVNKKEIFIMTLVITLLSYIITVFNIHKIIPIPLLQAPVLIIMFKYLFARNWKYSIVIILIGYVLFAAMEIGIGSIALIKDFVIMDDLQNAYAFKTYVMQTIDGCVGIAISGYLIKFNEGFAFTLKRKKSIQPKLFVSVAIALFGLLIAAGLVFLIAKSFISFIVILLLLIVSYIILIRLSIKRDEIEYA